MPEIVENHKDSTAVGLSASEHGVAVDDEVVFNARRLLQNSERLFSHGLGAFQRGGIRQFAVYDQITLVLCGNETRWGDFEADARQREQAEIEEETDRQLADQASDRPAITFCCRAKHSVKAAEEPTKRCVEKFRQSILWRAVTAQEKRAKRGT